MPIDTATLDQYITDVAGDDKELADTLRERLSTKEAAATNFMKGFMRNSDYTKKTQDLAKLKNQFETSQTEYENRITQAETEKDKIMRDLANERITGSRALALLKTVKEAYSLSDADLPGIEDIHATARTGKVVDSTPDLDTRFTEFENKLMEKLTTKLIPEISGLAMLGPIWNEIGHEHEALFGKRLSKKDQNEILEDARKTNRSLETVWNEKYNVPDKRLEARDAANKTKWEREFQDKQDKLSQEAALRSINPNSREFPMESQQSPMFKRSFAPKEPTEGTGEPTRTDATRELTSGADRAAAKFIERQRTGQLGKPLVEKATA